MEGTISKVLGPVTYMVDVNGNCVKRHVNQMLRCKIVCNKGAGDPGQFPYTGRNLDPDEIDMDIDKDNETVNPETETELVAD